MSRPITLAASVRIDRDTGNYCLQTTVMTVYIFARGQHTVNYKVKQRVLRFP
jgi:hypothetical protein